jgi:hypothetical protein
MDMAKRKRAIGGDGGGAGDGAPSEFLDAAAGELEAQGSTARRYADAPLMPFDTMLRLSRGEEEAMVSWFVRRVRELESEMGRSNALNSGWDSPSMAGALHQVADKDAGWLEQWMPSRRKHALMFANKYGWRQWLLRGTIFEKSNLTTSLSRRIDKQMVAKARKYLKGTDPWFSAEPQGAADAELSRLVNQYAQWKLRETGFDSEVDDAIEAACVLGEAVVRVSWHRDVDFFWARQTVLVNEEGESIGNPATGDVITEEEATPEMLSQMGIIAPVFAVKEVQRELVIESGAKVRLVHFTNFLCPLSARSIDEADMVCERYEESLSRLIDRYRKREVVAAAGGGDAPSDATQGGGSGGAGAHVRDLSSLVRLWLDLRANGNGGGASGDTGESLSSNGASAATRFGADDNVIDVAECWGYRDVNGSGIRAHVFLVVDMRSETPIFYEYAANCTPDGRRPYSAIRFQRERGAWYGIGGMETFEPSQSAADLFLNRMNVAQSTAGRIDLFDPEVVNESVNVFEDGGISLNWGRVFTKRKGKNTEDFLRSFYVDDRKSNDLRGMMETFFQLSLNESGIANGNDAQMAGMDTVKTATGVRNIEASGNEMFDYYIATLRTGLQGLLAKTLKMLFYYLDKPEAVEFSDEQMRDVDGDGAEANGERRPSLSEMTPEIARKLTLNVALLMTQYKGQQDLQQGQYACEIVEKFLSLPAAWREKLYPLYRKQLAGLGSAEIDPVRFISPPSPEEIAAEQAGLAGGGGGAPAPQAGMPPLPSEQGGGGSGNPLPPPPAGNGAPTAGFPLSNGGAAQ